MAKPIWRPFTLLLAAAFAAPAQPAGCNAPNASPSVTLALPMHPFAVAPAADGRWLFVSGQGVAGIAVLKRGRRAYRAVPRGSHQSAGRFGNGLDSRRQVWRTSMIRSEAEYQEASIRLAEERTRLAEHRARLKEAGLKNDEIKRVIDPMEPFQRAMNG
jgi:hypothetical protein